LAIHNFFEIALEFALQHKPHYIDCANKVVDLEGFTCWLFEQNATGLSTREVILLKLVLVVKRKKKKSEKVEDRNVKPLHECWFSAGISTNTELRDTPTIIAERYYRNLSESTVPE